jgi:hypothetical protein
LNTDKPEDRKSRYKKKVVSKPMHLPYVDSEEVDSALRNEAVKAHEDKDGAWRKKTRVGN